MVYSNSFKLPSSGFNKYVILGLDGQARELQNKEFVGCEVQ